MPVKRKNDAGGTAAKRGKKINDKTTGETGRKAKDQTKVSASVNISEKVAETVATDVMNDTVSSVCEEIQRSHDELSPDEPTSVDGEEEVGGIKSDCGGFVTPEARTKTNPPQAVDRGRILHDGDHTVATSGPNELMDGDKDGVQGDRGTVNPVTRTRDETETNPVGSGSHVDVQAGSPGQPAASDMIGFIVDNDEPEKQKSDPLPLVEVSPARPKKPSTQSNIGKAAKTKKSQKNAKATEKEMADGVAGAGTSQQVELSPSKPAKKAQQKSIGSRRTTKKKTKTPATVENKSEDGGSEPEQPCNPGDAAGADGSSESKPNEKGKRQQKKCPCCHTRVFNVKRHLFSCPELIADCKPNEAVTEEQVKEIMDRMKEMKKSVAHDVKLSTILERVGKHRLVELSSVMELISKDLGITIIEDCVLIEEQKPKPSQVRYPAKIRERWGDAMTRSSVRSPVNPGMLPARLGRVDGSQYAVKADDPVCEVGSEAPSLSGQQLTGLDDDDDITPKSIANKQHPVRLLMKYAQEAVSSSEEKDLDDPDDLDELDIQEMGVAGSSRQLIDPTKFQRSSLKQRMVMLGLQTTVGDPDNLVQKFMAYHIKNLRRTPSNVYGQQVHILRTVYQVQARNNQLVDRISIRSFADIDKQCEYLNELEMAGMKPTTIKNYRNSMINMIQYLLAADPDHLWDNDNLVKRLERCVKELKSMQTGTYSDIRRHNNAKKMELAKAKNMARLFWFHDALESQTYLKEIRAVQDMSDDLIGPHEFCFIIRCCMNIICAKKGHRPAVFANFTMAEYNEGAVVRVEGKIVGVAFMIQKHKTMQKSPAYFFLTMKEFEVFDMYVKKCRPVYFKFWKAYNSELKKATREKQGWRVETAVLDPEPLFFNTSGRPYTDGTKEIRRLYEQLGFKGAEHYVVPGIMRKHYESAVRRYQKPGEKEIVASYLAHTVETAQRTYTIPTPINIYKEDTVLREMVAAAREEAQQMTVEDLKDVIEEMKSGQSKESELADIDLESVLEAVGDEQQDQAPDAAIENDGLAPDQGPVPDMPTSGSVTPEMDVGQQAVVPAAGSASATSMDTDVMIDDCLGSLIDEFPVKKYAAVIPTQAIITSSFPQLGKIEGTKLLNRWYHQRKLGQQALLTEECSKMAAPPTVQYIKDTVKKREKIGWRTLTPRQIATIMRQYQSNRGSSRRATPQEIQQEELRLLTTALNDARAQNWHDVEKFTTTNVGQGLRARNAIGKKSYVCDYAHDRQKTEAEGERYIEIQLEAAQKRARKYLLMVTHPLTKQKTYLFSGSKMADTFGRYINHSPTCANLKLSVHMSPCGGDVIVVLFSALRDIKPGEELFWNYGVQYTDEPWIKTCPCKKCREDRIPSDHSEDSE